MITANLLGLLGAWIAAIVSPGPDLAQVIRVSARSTRSGVWAALGIMTGNAIWAAASLLGLAALINTYPAILAVLQILGGSYLVYMGVNSLRTTTESEGAPQRTQPMTPSQAWRAGVATNLANPKAILFFGAIFAQFITPEMTAAWGLAIFVAMVLIGLVWFLAVALATHTATRMILKNANLIDKIIGVVFVALGAYMVVDGLASVFG